MKAQTKKRILYSIIAILIILFLLMFIKTSPIAPVGNGTGSPFYIGGGGGGGTTQPTTPSDGFVCTNCVATFIEGTP